MTKEFTLKSILAGMLISIGCIAYLSVGSIPGAVLFSFGLICVICSRSKLFTGMAGFCESIKDYKYLIIALFFNIVGCTLIAGILPMDASGIVETRLSTDLIKLFLGAIGTGIIMTLAVGIARNQKNFIPLLLGIPLFILCGWPHCIADAYYYACNFCPKVILPYIITVLGNFVGCHINKIFGIEF